MSGDEPAAGGRAKVWDLSVRLCHWAFVLLIPAMWWTAENSQMGWHKRLGVLLLALLVFRILWGFFGSSTARFSEFLRAPGTVIAYFRSMGRDTKAVIGHNPAGGWSVVALLAAMSVQVTTGLFAGDPYDGAIGPLNDMVRAGTAGMLTEWHEATFNVILALIVLHLAAIVFYVAVKRDNLVRPMVTGKRVLPPGTKAMTSVPAWRGIACAVLAGGLALWVHNGLPGI